MHFYLKISTKDSNVLVLWFTWWEMKLIFFKEQSVTQTQKFQWKSTVYPFQKYKKPPLMLIKDFFCLFSFLACFPPLKYLPHHPLQWTTNFGKEKMRRRVTLEIKTNWIEKKRQMVKGHTYSSIKGVIHLCQMPVVCLFWQGWRHTHMLYWAAEISSRERYNRVLRKFWFCKKQTFSSAASDHLP